MKAINQRLDARRYKSSINQATAWIVFILRQSHYVMMHGIIWRAWHGAYSKKALYCGNAVISEVRQEASHIQEMRYQYPVTKATRRRYRRRPSTGIGRSRYDSICDEVVVVKPSSFALEAYIVTRLREVPHDMRPYVIAFTIGLHFCDFYRNDGEKRPKGTRLSCRRRRCPHSIRR